MKKTKSAQIVVLTAFLLSACAPNAGAAQPAATAELLAATTEQPAATEPPAVDEALFAFRDDVLYIGIMVHLEGWNDGAEEERFRLHAELVREYAELFEQYGAVLTLESREMTDGSIRWDDNVLLEMQQRGHGVGVHADIGGQRNYDCSRFADDLRAEKEQLESLGVSVLHVSGTVSHCDWVTASLQAGFEFTTGIVAYGVKSMPLAAQPEQFRDCNSPAACHQAYPLDLANRLSPWRAASGADWVTPIPEGGLVIIPSGGGLPCMAEEQRTSDSTTRCEFSTEDIPASIAELEEALSLMQPGRLNTYYVSWSLGNPIPPEMLEAWLQAIQPYAASGQVQWVSLIDMYEMYTAGN
jgi:hypothetical protein